MSSQFKRLLHPESMVHTLYLAKFRYYHVVHAILFEQKLHYTVRDNLIIACMVVGLWYLDRFVWTFRNLA